MREQVSVRDCRLGDLLQVSQVLRRSWMAAYAPFLGEATATAWGRRFYELYPVWWRYVVHDQAELVAVDEANRVVGHASYEVDDDELILWSLYVDPDRQGAGAGTALLNAVISRDPAARAVRLEVLQRNSAAIAWYQRRGFEIFSSSPTTFFGQPEPAHYMDLRLDRPSLRRVRAAT